ncbi:hypothetical protein DBR43_16545 [Pedobacter sp. KBW06]|uniref:hypothetical protein n=1 Tax=Pedobacter sp. KBW06 TaxID=2153359 RepID=UPI000F5A9D65|nr:hypothetical protein [Pedobacter sp. KBW06]RQO69677.1 hypothetical protein DBR43_16545 [Pedobacter sp. KBW06]
MANLLWVILELLLNFTQPKSKRSTGNALLGVIVVSALLLVVILIYRYHPESAPKDWLGNANIY